MRIVNLNSQSPHLCLLNQLMVIEELHNASLRSSSRKFLGFLSLWFCVDMILANSIACRVSLRIFPFHLIARVCGAILSHIGSGVQSIALRSAVAFIRANTR